MSRKQELYNQIILEAVLEMRIYAYDAKDPERNRVNLARINELCYLIHNIPHSLLQGELTNNDIGFVELAIPRYISRVEGVIESALGKLLFQFREMVLEQGIELTRDVSSEVLAAHAQLDRTR